MQNNVRSCLRPSLSFGSETKECQSLKEEIKQLFNLQASSEVAASILKNEVDELKQTKVEGLSEDPEMRLDFGSISSRGIKNDR